MPPELRSRRDDLIEQTDAFCQQYLNQEYLLLCRRLIITLCQPGESALVTHGEVQNWACGVVHALGSVNFLTEPYRHQQPIPSLTAAEIYDGFAVNPRTGAGKSKQIRDTVPIHHLDPRWHLPSRRGDMLTWLIKLDGCVVDARFITRDQQMTALQQGRIPYLPGQP